MKKEMGLKDWIYLVEFGEKDLTKRQEKLAIKFAIEQKNGEFAYKLACVVQDETDRKTCEKVVLLSKDAKYCYEFARDIPHANIKAFQKVLLEQNALMELCDFAGDVSGADVKLIQDFILSSKSPEASLRFAECVDNKYLNVKALQKVIETAKDASVIKKFINLELEGVNKGSLSLALGRCTKAQKRLAEQKREEEFVK